MKINGNYYVEFVPMVNGFVDRKIGVWSDSLKGAIEKLLKMAVFF